MLEAGLQYFKVKNKVYLLISLPFYFVQRNFSRIGSVQKMTIDATAAQLLYLGDLSLENRINPNYDFLSRSEISTLKHIR
jgi:hypothetical protein